MFALAKPDGEWLVLFPATADREALEVLFDPITIKAVRAARRKVRAVFDIDPEDNEEAGDEMSRELIRRGLREWRGVGDERGEPIAVTPEHVEAFIADPRTFEVADALYVIPWMIRDREGNVSSASPSGTGGAETRAPATAKRSARPRSTAAVVRTKPQAKKAAPTARTNLKATKASPPGT